MDELLNISVILPTYLREERIFITLNSITEQSHLPNQVIVINQTTGLQLVNSVKELYNEKGIDLTWVDSSIPSLCGARNIGIKLCSNDIAVCLDDDVNLPDYFFYNHLKMHLANPEYVAFGGQVYHRTNNYPISDLDISDNLKGTTAGYKNIQFEDFGPLFGGHFSVNVNVAKKIGGWNEYFMGSANWEEGDIMNRLKNAGYKFAYSSDLWLIHLREPGGCRIGENYTHPEWTKTYNFFLYKYRYPKDKTWYEVIITALRVELW
jgi:glycosyltransferase involved in cell wall biosynthesis